MTGRSLLPLITSQAHGPKEPQRNFVVFGRERHTPAQRKPSLEGYPSRALRTDRWLLILNLEPDRWPAGVPEGSSHQRIDRFSDCDNGPTKSAIMETGKSHETRLYYDLSFSKRPAIELYDCAKDPDQINNLAQNPYYADTLEQLRTQLEHYLVATEDPRFTENPIPLDGGVTIFV